MYPRSRQASTNVILFNGNKVKSTFVERILEAIKELMRCNYQDYIEFVEFCENYSNDEEGNELKIISWLKLYDDRLISAADIINVTLSAVDRDGVLHSPYLEDRQPQKMFSRHY